MPVRGGMCNPFFFCISSHGKEMNSGVKIKVLVLYTFTAKEMKNMTVLHLTISFYISSVMVIVIMLSRKVFKNQLSSKWQYNLWFLLLIALLLPYVPTQLLNFGNKFIWNGNQNSNPVSSGTTTENP